MTSSGEVGRGAAQLLGSEEFRSMTASVDRRPLIERADALGGPAMLLLHATTLSDLGRIPSFDEGRAVSAIEGIDHYGAHVVEVFMVSHRWLRPSLRRVDAHPDDENNAKARALNEFTLWRREWVRDHHEFQPEIFYWIDFSCIDQSEPSTAVAILPVWVACCERLLRVETPDYRDRAWCRVEPLLAHAFGFADHQMSIDLGFKFHPGDTGVVDEVVLDDPVGGSLTDPTDLGYITALRDVAQVGSATALDFGHTKVKRIRL